MTKFDDVMITSYKEQINILQKIVKEYEEKEKIYKEIINNINIRKGEK